MWDEEMMRKHNVTSIICGFYYKKYTSNKNEMPQNKKHMKVNYSIP